MGQLDNISLLQYLKAKVEWLLSQFKGGIINTIKPGANITIDWTDPKRPKISSAGGGADDFRMFDGTVVVAADRDLQASDANKILYLVAGVNVTMPVSTTLFDEHTNIGVFSETNTCSIERFPGEPVFPLGLGSQEAQIMLFVTGFGVGNQVTLGLAGECVIDDGGTLKTSSRYFYDNLNDGDVKLLETITLDNETGVTNVDFTTLPTTYSKFRIELLGVRAEAATGDIIKLIVGTGSGGGFAWQATLHNEVADHNFWGVGDLAITKVEVFASGLGVFCDLTGANSIVPSTTLPLNGHIIIENPHYPVVSARSMKSELRFLTDVPPLFYAYTMTNCWWTGTAQITGIRLQSANFGYGVFKLYGIK